MSKQLTEEFQAKIKEWAAANAATEATTFDETRYVGIIDGAWWMAEQLVEAQERIKTLEYALNELRGTAYKEDFGGYDNYVITTCDNCLSPNTVNSKEDE